MNRLVFLDCDGVLNGHERHANGYCGTRPDCVAQLNRIIAATDAKIVLTSSWRYIIDFAEMTDRAIENVLLTHGVDCCRRVLGHTRRDISEDRTDRGPQITEWLLGPGWKHFGETGRYVVLDNDDLEISECGHPFIQTDGLVGLTEKDADAAIAILLGATE